MNRQINRRTMIGAATATSVAMYHGALARPVTAAESPNDKLNVACVGVGGRGSANVSGLKSQNLVAFADVDDSRAGKAFESHPKTERFKDFRKLLDVHGSKLDAIAVSTPDHTHFHPSFAAMHLGINVYLEKPLAHNVWETRTLTDLARHKKLATQLGAQRHAIPNMHRVVELVQTGAIGKVTEVHSWVGGDRGMPKIPVDKPEIPDSVDYDLWVGPSKSQRGYDPSICPYGWRFWWDFGTGETGNWGCHILDIPFWALGLKYPTRVDASGPEVDPERTPKSMHCTFKFADTSDGGPVDLHWYHGTPKILKEKGLSSKGMNTLFIGDKGMLLCGFSSRKLLPENDFVSFKAPHPFIPDSPGFHKEFIAACRGGEPATCNFDYSGPLAETVLLGNVAYRTGGFDWDAKTLRTGSNEKAQSLIKETYRKGWEV